jgi:hypothetical protein
LQRDPRGVNLRFETPAVSEYLIANLLAPAGAGVLAPRLSDQEYSKLFEQEHLGLVSQTEYLSRGDWTQYGAQYGSLRNLDYSVDALYKSENGQRSNNDRELTIYSALVKQQFTGRDAVFLQTVFKDESGGDLRQSYYPEDAFQQPGPDQSFRFRETQEPLFLAGYHREWSPASHTLILFGRLQDSFEFQRESVSPLLSLTNQSGDVVSFQPGTEEYQMRQDYQSDFVIYTAEAQQIWQSDTAGIVTGLRYQTGDFSADNSLTALSDYVTTLFGDCIRPWS